MEITRTSPVSGITRTMSLPVTQEQLNRVQAGGYVQNIFPNLSADEREFILTGITPDEWDELFPE